MGSHAIECKGGRTRQSEKEACDINKILARFTKTKMISHVNSKTPLYADVSSVTSYKAALDEVAKTDEFFMGLPAKVRARFKNDAVAFLDFVTDPKNAEAMKEMGLVKGTPPKENPAESKPPVVA